MSRCALFFAAVLLLAPPALAGETAPESAADLYAKGEALLKQADFAGALAQYLAAVRADPSNEACVARARLVGRVIATRKAVEGDAVTPHWERMAASLHVFYLGNALLPEAEALDRRAHRLLGNAESASRLAETLIELGKDAEAVSLVEGLATGIRTPANLTWLAIGLARLGKKEEAAKAAEGAVPAEGAAPWTVYHAARASALLGREAETAALVSRCLETAPAAVAAAIRAHAAACPDFARIREAKAFAEALKTAPKAESACSGGEGCGSCPSRSGCGK